MSNRTREANKAVAKAWELERNRVLSGFGTRDWTLEQQKDIVEKGKAYDEHGNAFQGHHMKSVEIYPQFQGDPINIQFLSPEEHLNAHGGDWRNKTNGYYDFAAGRIIPFKDEFSYGAPVIQLSNRYVASNSLLLKSDSKDGSKNKKEVIDEPLPNSSPQVPLKKSAPIKSGISKSILNYLNNPIFKIAAKEVGLFVLKTIPYIATYVVTRVVTNRGINKTTPDNSVVQTQNILSNNNPTILHEETIGPSRQRYHYKDGTIRWVDKLPYIRNKGK